MHHNTYAGVARALNPDTYLNLLIFCVYEVYLCVVCVIWVVCIYLMRV